MPILTLEQVYLCCLTLKPLVKVENNLDGWNLLFRDEMDAQEFMRSMEIIQHVAQRLPRNEWGENYTLAQEKNTVFIMTPTSQTRINFEKSILVMSFLVQKIKDLRPSAEQILFYSLKSQDYFAITFSLKEKGLAKQAETAWQEHKSQEINRVQQEWYVKKSKIKFPELPKIISEEEVGLREIDPKTGKESDAPWKRSKQPPIQDYLAQMDQSVLKQWEKSKEKTGIIASLEQIKLQWKEVWLQKKSALEAWEIGHFIDPSKELVRTFSSGKSGVAVHSAFLTSTAFNSNELFIHFITTLYKKMDPLQHGMFSASEPALLKSIKELQQERAESTPATLQRYSFNL